MDTKFLDPLRRLYHRFGKNPEFTDSSSYWKSRYKAGGNSGWGSYDKFAKFKAKVINEFIVQNAVNQAIEFGCGDGNQCKLFKFDRYIGIDISEVIIDQNKSKYDTDSSKEFYVDGQELSLDLSKVQLSLSLDVIYHLVEDSIFESYMNKLFNYKYVIVYSSNFSGNKQSHVRHRKFTDWVESNKENWKLISHIKNEFPFDPNREVGETSPADFYIYHNSQL